MLREAEAVLLHSTFSYTYSLNICKHHCYFSKKNRKIVDDNGNERRKPAWRPRMLGYLNSIYIPLHNWLFLSEPLSFVFVSKLCVCCVLPSFLSELGLSWTCYSNKPTQTHTWTKWIRAVPMSRSAGVLDTKLRAAKKKDKVSQCREITEKQKQNQIKSWMSCWRVELQRSRSCTLVHIIQIIFKALLFNVVWTEIEFLNKKK
jgi:hypothetical protein